MKRLIISILLILSLWGAKQALSVSQGGGAWLVAGELGDVKPTQGQESKGVSADPLAIVRV